MDKLLKPLGLSRRKSDDGRESRFQRAISPKRDKHLSPSTASASSQSIKEDKEDLVSEPSLSPTQTLADLSPQPPEKRLDSRSGSRGTGLSRKASDNEPGALGLSVLHTPGTTRNADIVFVHGLGGTSRKTWSKDNDPELFWPLKFLPSETDIASTRILTFGYNANFRMASKVSISVLDFAKDLLFDLKYAKDDYGKDLNIGETPLIFVAHSMGGLIVKEAYIQGQNDPEYESIVKAISAIVFLSTPHRGTNLAELLDRILRSAFFIGSKPYISELAQNSFTLQKLNEQFRHIAPKLNIVSFYETLATPLGLMGARVMILEKDSSVLGYPGEVSKPLDADHHNVCKYSGLGDPNYISVKNALKSLVHKVLPAAKPEKPKLLSSRQQSFDIKALLAISELPDVDYIFYRDQWTPGTTGWILTDEEYKKWLETPESASAILWCHGGAGFGKSVMSSFIINDLFERGLSCQYFFFKYGEHKKRTLSSLFRSLAYQVARSTYDFQQRVLQLAEEGIDFESADSRTIWERIFKLNLLLMKGLKPLYWIIDGLDEADDPRGLVRLLTDVSHSSVPIRICLVGRRTTEMMAIFQKVPQALGPGIIKLGSHSEDLERYIHQELSMSGDDKFKEEIVQRIVREAQNSFLWVRFAVDRLNLCHTQDDVERSLKELPVGMAALYDRMALSIGDNLSSTDKRLATTILEFVCCSLHELTIAELSGALHENNTKMLDFHRSVVDLCGGFVVVDNGGNVSMIHHTAREYLLTAVSRPRPFCIDQAEAHKKLFLSCMRCLMTVGLRTKMKGTQKPDFLEYAASTWSSHLIYASTDSEEVLDTLKKFLTGNYVLTWIHILAIQRQLRVMIQASKNLVRFSAKQDKHLESSSMLQQALFESWAEDLVKIVGKFGLVLRRSPESIYKAIPAFSPKNSAIYQQFGDLKDKSLIVYGLSAENWDDTLARMSLPFGTFASSILARGAQVAILGSPGIVVLFDSFIFEESPVSPIRHGERVYRIELSGSGTILATHGFSTTKIWETTTGQCKITVKNLDSKPRPLAMLISNDNSMLLVGYDDRRIRSLNLNETSPKWQLVAELEEPEIDGHFLNASSHMALNRDGDLISVAYRGHPLSAWEIEGPTHIGHCWRKREMVARGEVQEAVWHPHNPEVIGLYIEGVVFKWQPYDDEVDELVTGASRLSMSRDGNLFATGDVRGMIKVYTTADFGLLYSLASEDTVLALAFSPDLRRFYDIRGYYANAWEPNALLRYSEQRNRNLDVEVETFSMARTSLVAQSRSIRIDAVTTLATSPSGRLYCCGTETGGVFLNDTKQGNLANLHKSKSFLSIERMSWSNDGRWLSFSDSSSKVTILRINVGASEKDKIAETKARLPMKTEVKGPLLQLLFHPDSSRLAVRSASTTCVVSLDSFSVLHKTHMQTSDCTCITHPLDMHLILVVSPTAVHVLDWSLVEHQTYQLVYLHYSLSPAGRGSSSDQAKADRVLVTHDKRRLLLQVSGPNKHSKDRKLLYFDTPPPPKADQPQSSSPKSLRSPTKPGSIPQQPDASAQASQNQATPPAIIAISPNIVSETISSRIAFPLCFLPHNTLVLLSRSYVLCSWRLPIQFSAPILSTPSPTTYGMMPSTSPIEAEASSTQSVVESVSSRKNSGKSNSLAPPRRETDDNPEDKIFKPLFSLPGDWISWDCLKLCRIWTIEKSFLCPRNGEVAVVRCAALA